MDKDKKSLLVLESSAFKNGGQIPSKFTCDGENINPELIINNVPVEAKSLVLIMDDPDIPEAAKINYGIEVWEHWTVFDIPPETSHIPEGSHPGGIVGKNSRGKNAYGGPCPPDREHRYFFKLFALDTMLNLPETSVKSEVEQAMQGHIIAEVELIGRYNRQ